MSVTQAIARSRSKLPRCVLTLACLGSTFLATVVAQDVHIWVSSEAGDRLSAKPTLHFKSRAPEPRTFKINEAVNFQRIDGFGASFLEAGLICLNSLSPEQQETVLRALFDPKEGAGFSVMKTVIASTDFMSAGPFYSYDEVPGDVEMKHFSIARDLGPNGLITYIKRARQYGRFLLQAPLDYPPDWMLYDLNKNQDVNSKYYDALALYYLRYLEEYQKQGVFVDYLSLFNEPGIYTKIRYEKIRALLRDYVGPLLERAGVRTKLMLSEAPDRTDAYRNYPIVLEDLAARSYVAIAPYHGYRGTGKEFAEMADLHRRYPDIPLWMTEICHAYDAGTPKSMSLPRYDFKDGDFWGNQIFNDLETHASAWIYWNMILDEKGGPWAVSVVHGNPDPNVQHPVVIINRQTKKVTYTGLYHYLAHFSKFVRPGAVRIQTTGSQSGVRVISFKLEDGQIVSELMNSARDGADVNVSWHGRLLKLRLPAVSITTAEWAGK